MTKQKFYEMCVMKTYQCTDANNKTVQKELELLGIEDEIGSMTFKQLVMRRELAGLPPFPTKENFKVWGGRYLSQLMGFAAHLDDCRFTDEFFKFLNKNVPVEKSENSIVQPKDMKEFGEMCFYAFTDRFLAVADRDFCTQLASFMIFRFKDAKWFGRFLTMASTSSMFDLEARKEYFRIVGGGRPPAETFMNAVKEASNG